MRLFREKNRLVFIRECLRERSAHKKIMKKITRNLMIPHWGCHIVAGTMVKLPVIPIGFYLDGKLMIPFDNVDKYTDLGGFGFLLNTGVSLSF